MGEMADDMIDGSSCSWCGVYFVQEHGFPVVCRGCAIDASKYELEKSGLQVATHEEC